MVIDRFKLVALLPSKTGSSSLRGLFLEQRVLQRPEFRRLPYPHYHLYLSELALVHGLDSKSLAKYKLVQVTRDPIHRFISAWKHQERILGHSIEVEDLLDKLYFYKFLLPDQWEEFYLKFYDDPDHQIKSFQKGNWGGVRFYVDQVDWNDLNLNVCYFKLEELSVDIAPLSEFLQLNLPPLPQKNKGNYSETVGSLLTYSLKEKVYQLFKRDFKAFNYEF